MLNAQFVTNKPTYVIGLFQSSCIAAYVLLFIYIANKFGQTIGESSSLLAPAVFLLTFVVSALICGVLMLGYPATLAINGRIADAFKIICWGIFWLIILVLIAISIILIYT